MSFKNLFKSLTSTSPRRRPSRARLYLEALEDRCLLSFSPAVSYPVGTSPQAVVTADFNRDSRLDLAVVNSGSNTVSVLLGNANGTFQSALASATGGGPHSVAVGDFNGDFKLDLATANAGDVSVLLGNGDGTFQAPQSIPLPAQFPPGSPYATAQYPSSVATGDFNGDGKLDLIAASSTFFQLCSFDYCYFSSEDGYVNVLLGNGTGGFGAADVHHLGTYRIPSAVAVGDLNNDGQPDVVTANNVALSVLLGNGTGAVGSPIHTGSGSALRSISLGDVDGDGKLDTVMRSGSTLIVQKGQGDGRFVPSSTVEMGQAVDSAVVGDVNADGKLDLVAVGSTGVCTSPGYYGCYDGFTTRQSTVVLGNGQGSFSLPIASSLGTIGAYDVYFRFADVALTDLTGDGLPELATINNNTHVAIIARNDGNWTRPVEIYISDVTVLEGNNGTVNAVFTVMLAQEHDGVVSVDFATADNSAIAGADYVAQAGTLSFGPGVSRQTIAVPVIGDRLGEGDEQLLVNLSNPIGALFRDGQGVGTIADNEPSISIDHPYDIDPLTVIEGDVGTTPAVFTVTLSMPYDQEVTVDYSTLTGHTSDIIAAAGTLRFAVGETSKTITVQVVGDLLDEALEAFNVYLTNATPNAFIAAGAGYCFIEDNDPTPPSISISDVSKSEGKKGQTTLFTFTVTLSAAYDQPVTMSFRTVNGTAKTSDNDYVAKTGTLTFNPGETTKTITIAVKGDSKREANETFYLDLFGNSGNSLFTKNRAIGTILNDD